MICGNPTVHMKIELNVKKIISRKTPERKKKTLEDKIFYLQN